MARGGCGVDGVGDEAGDGREMEEGIREGGVSGGGPYCVNRLDTAGKGSIQRASQARAACGLETLCQSLCRCIGIRRLGRRVCLCVRH